MEHKINKQEQRLKFRIGYSTRKKYIVIKLTHFWVVKRKLCWAIVVGNGSLDGGKGIHIIVSVFSAYTEETVNNSFSYPSRSPDLTAPNTYMWWMFLHYVGKSSPFAGVCRSDLCSGLRITTSHTYITLTVAFGASCVLWANLFWLEVVCLEFNKNEVSTTIQESHSTTWNCFMRNIYYPLFAQGLSLYPSSLLITSSVYCSHLTTTTHYQRIFMLFVVLLFVCTFCMCTLCCHKTSLFKPPSTVYKVTVNIAFYVTR